MGRGNLYFLGKSAQRGGGKGKRQTEMILLGISLGPAAHESGHGADSRFEVVLDSPQGEITPDVGGETCKHARPLPTVSPPKSAPYRTQRGKVEDDALLDSRIGIDAPWFVGCFDGGNPLLRERLVAGAAQLPRVARRWVGTFRAARFDVQPVAGGFDAGLVNRSQEVGELGCDRFAGDAIRGSGAC